jgi:arabinose-5-phosphate isomerase
MSQNVARKVLEIESDAIRELIGRIDGTFDRAVELLFGCSGRVVVTGMGKSGIIGQKISATLASTGTPSFVLHPSDAIHGDLGRIVAGDVVIAVSSSGDTGEILALLPTIKRLGVPIIAVTGNPRSALATTEEVHLDASIRKEACPLGLAPTASTTVALAMGDALAMAVLERRGFTAEDFAERHPGGQLGKKLVRVEDLMHTGDQIPRVHATDKMKDVLFEMTRKRLGLTTVVDADGRLLGLISDGDLRRGMEHHGYTFLDHTALECMTKNPSVIGRRELATRALDVMEQKKITSLLVPDDAGRVEGVLHLHDLWKTEMI